MHSAIRAKTVLPVSVSDGNQLWPLLGNGALCSLRILCQPDEPDCVPLIAVPSGKSAVRQISPQKDTSWQPEHQRISKGEPMLPIKSCIRSTRLIMTGSTALPPDAGFIPHASLDCQIKSQVMPWHLDVSVADVHSRRSILQMTEDQICLMPPISRYRLSLVGSRPFHHCHDLSCMQSAHHAAPMLRASLVHLNLTSE